MLCIFLAVGGFGAFIMLFFIIFEMLSRFRSWYSVRDYAVKMLIFIVLGLIGLFGHARIGYLSYEEVVAETNGTLMLITDGSDEKFYVCKSNDDEIYSFYYKVDDDCFKGVTVKTDSAVIYEKDDCNPHVVEYTYVIKNKMNKLKRRILTLSEYDEIEQKKYDIYLPKGSMMLKITQ